ncbi:OsmC family peroxiredoxin [Luteibacter aegosomatissinici]|uniref:OsmC family peroxiredoxin n=1 Tax=Luteibacter aegosomatissinici TaxID=2911539 RepID=UPI001FFC1141|nr:OsmC family peroxiredoxin [Luteibacter aegosomatissinici]UPG92734.1 OsmC family peroxiredoxin [Luteibacter aegosomatissinici]
MKAIGYSDWSGTWKEGAGSISTDSLTVPKTYYSFATRFEGANGASPEELLAAAEAGCFNQALANNFGMNGLKAESIATSAVVEMGHDDKGSPTIVGILLKVEAVVPGATQEVFDQCVERARTRCSIAKVLKLDIRVEAALVVN